MLDLNGDGKFDVKDAMIAGAAMGMADDDDKREERPPGGSGSGDGCLKAVLWIVFILIVLKLGF